MDDTRAPEVIPGRSSAPPKKRGRVSGPGMLLIVVVLLLGVSLVVPWWSETEVGPGPEGVRSTQSYAPLAGVMGTCSPSCPAYETGPPIGPIQGAKSFSSLGLNRTATLYYAGLGLVTIGLAGTALAVVTLPARVATSGPRGRFHTVFLSVALLATVAASAALACLQPIAFRADASSTFSPSTAWTASPSPETSFWGSCVPGPTNGVCASGWSVAWGPGPGWYLITIAAVVLMAVLFLRSRGARGPPAPPSVAG